MSRAYYNEIDPYAADWLRGLIAAKRIPEGTVDERDIRDVTARSSKLRAIGNAIVPQVAAEIIEAAREVIG